MKMLLVEDNLGDARLLRESLKELHEQDFEIVLSNPGRRAFTAQ